MKTSEQQKEIEVGMTGLEELVHRLQQEIGGRRAPRQETVETTVACQICGDLGIVYSGDVARICSCRRHAGKLQQQAGIAPELCDYSFENFKFDFYDGQHRERAMMALQDARQFVQDCAQGKPVRGMVLTGDVGSGKTFLAAAIVNGLLKQGTQAQFLVVPDFLDDLRTALLHNPGDSREPDDVALLRTVRQVAVLVLDDLGAHNYTEWTCNKLYSLLNYRLNFRLPVIITTNLKMSELDEYLGERTTSRIVQMCRIYRLTVDRDIRHLIK